jgi:uncharacterized protein
MEVRPFKILSIDGGGIKGLYSAKILEHLEDEFCKKDGKMLSDYFDMICGTSTGGLIALAIATKTPTHQISQLYKMRGENIFPNTSSWQQLCNSVKQKAWGGKYKNDKLKIELEVLFSDKTMSDAQNLLCIPTFNLTESRPTVWKYPHKEGNYTRDKKIKMVDVALSTAAAPTYFPIHEISGIGRFIDGGVWANNPTLCGVLEAIDFYLQQPNNSRGIMYDSLQILSISSVNKPTAQALKGSLNKSFLGWQDKLFNPFFEGQSYFVDRFIGNGITKIYPKSIYYRIPSPNLSPEQAEQIDLDKVNKCSIELLEQFGNTVGYDHLAAKRHLVTPFFENFKTYQTA